MYRSERTTVLAIGAGPANLSLAALADPVGDLRVSVVESRSSVSWHPGLLSSDARLQASSAKDLVSLVNPRSRFSFLNFLHEQGRLYRHLVAGGDCVSRKEFDQYFRWAAGILPVSLGERVVSVHHNDTRGFIVRTTRGCRMADDIVLGVGQEPHLPECARHISSPWMWHASRHLDSGVPVNGRDVLLVGGGQSAAEVALDLLSGRTGLPRRLIWATGDAGLVPLDDSPFSDEWFNPRFVEYFRELSAAQRLLLLERQRPAAGGVTGDLLRRLYRKLYELDYLTQTGFSHELLACSRLAGLTETPNGFHAALRDTITGTTRDTVCDVVVLATGYRPALPEFMAPLRDRMALADGTYRTEGDYRVGWDGPDLNRIYVQNGARRSHGIADSTLGLAAWRGAVIINSLLGHDQYPLKAEDITLSLDRMPDARAVADVDFHQSMTRTSAS